MRGILNLCWVDLSLIFAAIVGGLGGIIVAAVGNLPLWAHRTSVLFFGISILFLFIRHFVIRSRR